MGVKTDSEKLRASFKFKYGSSEPLTRLSPNATYFRENSVQGRLRKLLSGETKSEYLNFYPIVHSISCPCPSGILLPFGTERKHYSLKRFRTTLATRQAAAALGGNTNLNALMKEGKTRGRLVTEETEEKAWGWGKGPDLLKDYWKDEGRSKDFFTRSRRTFITIDYQLFCSCFFFSLSVKQIGTDCPASKDPWKGTQEVVLDLKELSIQLGRSNMKNVKQAEKQ